MSKIQGNIEDVRKRYLEYLEAFLEKLLTPGSFVPEELVEVLTYVTGQTGKEIGVYLNRRNRVEAIIVGDQTSVSLPFMDTRRGDNRLSGIRLIHTHPNGSYLPSSLDIASLKTLRLDAMIVLGIEREEEAKVTGLSATILGRDQEGRLTETEIIGPYNVLAISRFDELFDRLEEIDKGAGDLEGEKTGEGNEKAILVGLAKSKEEEDLAELHELAYTAGAHVLGSYTQRRDRPDSRYYIGQGFAKELAYKRQKSGANLIIFDDELSYAQIRNLEGLIGAKVIDRTALILDIFAQRAKSIEGKYQVELAQMHNLLPRLTGYGQILSRLGGGIGTRGPGETKLETDRRAIRRKISFLEKKLKEIEQRRQVIRAERQRNEIPTISLVGYTNTGKSSLMSLLSQTEAFIENKLFATLDSTVRKMETKERGNFLIVDTVGFIKKLPHKLIEAFKSTLEEATSADLLLHVVDGSSNQIEDNIHVVEEILEDIGAGDKPRYLVVNKMDIASEDFFLDVKAYEKVFYVSALTGQGIEKLKEESQNFFLDRQQAFSIKVPYKEAWVLPFLHENGQVENEEYGEDGIYVEGLIPLDLFHRIKDFERG